MVHSANSDRLHLRFNDSGHGFTDLCYCMYALTKDFFFL